MNVDLKNLINSDKSFDRFYMKISRRHKQQKISIFRRFVEDYYTDHVFVYQVKYYPIQTIERGWRLDLK